MLVTKGEIMVYTKKMILQALSIMSLVLFVPLAEAMDKKGDAEKRAARSQNNYLPTAKEVLSKAEKAEQSNLTAIKSDIKRTERPALGQVPFVGFSQDKPEQDRRKKDSALTDFVQPTHAPRLTFKKIEPNPEEIAAEKKQQAAQKRQIKAALDAEKKEPETKSHMAQLNQKFNQIDNGTPLKSEFVKRGKLLSDVPGAPLKAANKDKMEPKKKDFDLSLADNLFGSLSSAPSSPEKMEFDTSYGQFDNSFADSTPPASPKKDRVTVIEPAVLRSQNNWTPTATENLTNAQGAGQKNLTDLSRRVRKAQDSKQLKQLQIDFSDEDN